MRIVIVGAGPVGLYTAIALQEFGQVTVLEKRSAPSRQQIVMLDQASLKSLPPVVRETLFTKGNGCYIRPPALDETAACYRTPLDRAGIQLDKLERALESYAKSLGVRVWRNVDPKLRISEGYVKLGDRRLPYDLLIGADGSNSRVAKAIGCKKISLARKSYGLIVLLKARSKRQRARLGKKQDSSRTFRTRDNDLYIGLTIPRSLAKNPLSPAVKLTILKTCALSGTPCSLADARLSLIEIEPFRTSCWSKVINGKLHALVGDAAISTHFFTGLGVNNGFRMADRLVKHLENQRPLDYSDLADQVQSSVGSVMTSLKKHDELCRLQSKPDLEDRVDKLLARFGLQRSDHFSKPELCLILGDRL